jgi:hypothetical protein
VSDLTGIPVSTIVTIQLRKVIMLRKMYFGAVTGYLHGTIGGTHIAGCCDAKAF